MLISSSPACCLVFHRIVTLNEVEKGDTNRFFDISRYGVFISAINEESVMYSPK